MVGRSRGMGKREPQGRTGRSAHPAPAAPAKKAGPVRRSGFAALIGLPNVGKSTLLNRLTGEKLAIVSPKPQTTRNRILGVVTRGDLQVAFLDTPGVHSAKGELHRYMREVAFAALEEVDLVVLMVDAALRARRPEPDEQEKGILARLSRLGRPTLLVLNKIDEVQKALLLPLIDRYRQAYAFLEIVPLSAKTGDGVDRLLELVGSHLPEGEWLFPEDMLTDQAERTLVAEYVREQVLRNCRQEIPYSAAVVVEVFDESDREPKAGKVAKPGGLAGLVRIAASIFVERDSQKAIVIGKRGAMLKKIGTDARVAIERFLGTHVFLSLRVKVEPRWSERADGLRKMGYE